MAKVISSGEEWFGNARNPRVLKIVCASRFVI